MTLAFHAGLETRATGNLAQIVAHSVAGTLWISPSNNSWRYIEAASVAALVSPFISAVLYWLVISNDKFKFQPLGSSVQPRICTTKKKKSPSSSSRSDSAFWTLPSSIVAFQKVSTVSRPANHLITPRLQDFQTKFTYFCHQFNQ